MRKEGVLLSVFFLMLLFSACVFAEVSNQTAEAKAYSCLESRITGKCSSLPFEDTALSLLALGYNSKLAGECQKALEALMSPSEFCFPSGGCKLKETALATIALNNLGADVSSQINWLASKTRNTDKLVWYLQIEAASSAICRIKYGETEYAAKIGDDKKISISSNLCLKSSGYLLEISKDCIDRAYEVSCNADFISSLVYKSSASSTIFVSNSIESASSGGSTQNIVQSKCFKEGTSCDYAGSLWAAFALLKAHKDVKPYLPYLFAFAEENAKAVPYSFLYAFTAEDEYRSKLMNEQKPEGYWDWGTGRGKFYDTAMTLFAFQNEKDYSSVIESVKAYLSDNQPKEGCWQNSVRDTAFLLWTLWPKETKASTTQQACESSFCMTEGECEAAGGSIKEKSYCAGLKICCDKTPSLKLCRDMSGVECTSGQECSSSLVSSLDAEGCCLAECLPISEERTECENNNYVCKPFCSDDEEEAGFSCTSGDKCCKPKKGGSALIWIVILLFLIGLAVIGIIYKNKLRLWFYKFREGFKTKFQKKPPAAPAQAGRFVYQPRQQPARASISKELEETLKKLREIAK